jgi:hypothetical protein
MTSRRSHLNSDLQSSINLDSSATLVASHNPSTLKGRKKLALFVYLVTVILEVFTATGNLVLVFRGSQSRAPYLEFVIAAYPRIVLFILMSYLTHRKKWWRQYYVVDHPFAAVITTCIGYSYLIWSSKPDDEPILGIRLHANILFPIVYACLAGKKLLPCPESWTSRNLDRQYARPTKVVSMDKTSYVYLQDDSRVSLDFFHCQSDLGASPIKCKHSFGCLFSLPACLPPPSPFFHRASLSFFPLAAICFP